jgi:hypothetical protein
MPVLQNDNSAGDIIGGIAGTVGAFLHAQNQAKLQRADAARQAALDAQTVAETMYRHAEDAKRDTIAENADTRAQGEFALKQKGQLDAENLDAANAATATAVAHFQQRMKYPANWNRMKPEQQIAYLQQRLNHEQQMPGAEKLVGQTQKEIEDIQRPLIAAANQAAATGRSGIASKTQMRDTDVRESGALNRLNIRIENPRGGGSGNSGLSPRAGAVESRAMAAPDLKSALRIVEQGNLPRSDRSEVRQDVMDQFRQPAEHDLSGLSAKGNNDLKHDTTLWTINGSDPNAMPDPNNAKYEKKINVVGGNRAQPAPASAATPAPPSGGGAKTVVGSDGHTYEQLPNGKWKVIK